MTIPSLLLKKLYTLGSLTNTATGTRFALKNRLSDAEVVASGGVAIDGRPVPPGNIRLDLGDGVMVSLSAIDLAHPFPFPVGAIVTVEADTPELPAGKHEVEIAFETRPFGKVQFKVEDAIGGDGRRAPHIPRDEGDDYDAGIIRRRQALVEQTSGTQLRHVSQYSFDPHVAKGNCENFTGVAQVPMGFAGPLQVHGEHAEGEFLLGLLTTGALGVTSHRQWY